MAPVAEKHVAAEKDAEKMVAVINQGAGPMDTAHGKIMPGGALSLPESLAKKIVGAYRHIKLASDVVPGAGEGVALAAEKAKLQAQVKELEAKLKGADEQAAAVVKDLLGAENKKDLDVLKAKYASPAA